MMNIPKGAVPIEEFQAHQDAQPLSQGAPSGAIPVDQFQSAEDKYGSAGQMALTSAEHVAQGFAGPVATGVERGLSALGVPGITPEDQEMRTQTNPLTAYGSEAGGFGLGAFTGTGVAGLIGKIGEGAVAGSNIAKGASLGSKALTAGIRAGAEVGALQVGNEASKVINDPSELLADPGKALGNAAINIGLAGILGGVGGAVLGSVSPGWKAFTARAAAEEGIPQVAEMASAAATTATPEMADAAAQVAAPKTGDVLTDAIQKPSEKESFLKGIQKQKANADEIREAGATIGVPVSPSQTSASDFVQSMDSALTQSPTIAGIQRQQEVQNGFDKIGGIVEQTVGGPSEISPFERGQMIKDQIQNKVDTMYDPLKEGYKARAALGETIALPDQARQKMFNNLIELSQKFGKASPEIERMVADTGQGLLRQDTVSDLDEYLKVLSEKQRNLRISGENTAAQALGEAAEKLQDFQVRQIAKQGAALQAEGAEHAEAISSDIIRQHKELKARYAEFKSILGDLASDAHLGKKATTAGGIEDVLGNISNEKLVDKMFDKKNSAGLARLKDKFPDVFQTVIQGKKSQLIENATLNGELNHKALLKSIFDSKTGLSPEIRSLMFSPEEQKMLSASKTWIDSLPKNVGPSGTPKGTAYMNALAGMAHPTVTGMIDRLAGSVIQNVKATGIKAALRFATPAEVEANTVARNFMKSSYDGAVTLDKSVKAFFKTGELIPQHLLPDKEKRARLETALEHFQAPENALNVGGSLGHYLPDHQTAAAMHASQAANYLNALKPNPQPGNPFDMTPPVDKAAQAKYNRALDVAEQPLMVLKHAKDGSLLPQDVQTLQQTNPTVHAQIVQKLTNELVDQKAHERLIPYRQKQSLALLLGSPLDSTMTPQSMQAVINSAGSAGTQAQQQQQKQGHASQATLKQMGKVNDLYKMPEDRSQDQKNR